MKIIIHSLDDLNELVSVLSPAYLRTFNTGLGPSFRAADIAREVRTGATGITQLLSDEVARMARGEPEGLPGDIEQPVNSRGQTYDEVVAATAKLHEAITGETLDADGVPHSTDWHSDPPKINADGRWKARRGRDNDAYKAWLREQSVFTDGPIDAADAEPVATETHALPQDEDSRDAGADYAGEGGKPQNDQQAGLEEMELVNDEMVPVATPTVDLAALVEASQEAALDASDSHMDLIKACQAFISDHGHPAYNALKAAVAPLEGAENGKAVPQFTPAERRLMRACIENYPKA